MLSKIIQIKHNNMRTQLFLLLFFCFLLNATAQTGFENGYFINNNGQKTDCLIRNKDWKNNPTEFQYKKSVRGNVLLASIETVIEFGINNKTKYVREQVTIDRSSNNLKTLSEVKKAAYKEEVLFLKVLVEGEANLYHYNEKDLNRFFYSKPDVPITQLVYKRYKVDEQNYGENNRYKQQLITHLQCYAPLREKEIVYFRKYLVSLFIKYNECKEIDYVEFDTKIKFPKFIFSLKAGLMLNSFSMASFNKNFVTHDNLIGFKAGFAVEYILPFNNNRWVLQLEPVLQIAQFDKTSPNTLLPEETITNTLDLKSIELSGGIKHLFFLNEQAKIFIDAFTVVDFSLVTALTHRNVIYSNTLPLTNFSFGLGYELNDHFNLELRYSTRKNLLNYNVRYEADFKGLAVILGYRF